MSASFSGRQASLSKCRQLKKSLLPWAFSRPRQRGSSPASVRPAPSRRRWLSSANSPMPGGHRKSNETAALISRSSETPLMRRGITRCMGSWIGSIRTICNQRWFMKRAWGKTSPSSRLLLVIALISSGVTREQTCSPDTDCWSGAACRRSRLPWSVTKCYGTSTPTEDESSCLVPWRAACSPNGLPTSRPPPWLGGRSSPAALALSLNQRTFCWRRSVRIWMRRHWASEFLAVSGESL